MARPMLKCRIPGLDEGTQALPSENSPEGLMQGRRALIQNLLDQSWLHGMLATVRGIAVAAL